MKDDSPLQTREEILGKFKDYAVDQIDRGFNIKSLTRHIIGLYQGQPGARHYRRMLSDAIPKEYKCDLNFSTKSSTLFPNTFLKK